VIWGNWKKWREYYPTILYYIIGSLSYNFIFYKKPLWLFQSLINHTFSEYLDDFVLWPCAIILFFTFLPRTKIIKQMVYTFIWAIFLSSIEGISYITKNIVYINGWNYLYTIAFNCILFPLLALHYKYPLIVWPISGGLALLVMLLFDVPISSLI
jgi:hypothetical protein